METLQFALPQKTTIGENSLDTLGKESALLGSKALLVLGRHFLKESGIYERVINLLKEDRVKWEIYEGVAPEPDVEAVEEGRQRAIEAKCDHIIAIGGGSVIDIAKAIGVAMTNQGPVSDYHLGKKTIQNTSIPVLAVPTTAGTGAEASMAAVLKDRNLGIKKSIHHFSMVTRSVILDPCLTIKLPPSLTATTGIDALSHAIESYVSTRENPFAEAVGLKAIELIGRNLRKVVADGNDMDARTKVLVGSYLAGLSIMKGVGTGHMLSHPIGAAFNISHGESLGILLPVSMKFNFSYAPEKYAKVAQSLDVADSGMSKEQAAEASYKEVARICQDVGIKTKLRDFKITRNDYDLILERVRMSTAHIKTNPRPVNNELLIAMLDDCI